MIFGTLKKGKAKTLYPNLDLLQRDQPLIEIYYFYYNLFLFSLTIVITIKFITSNP